MDIPPSGEQVHDRIADELTWRVESDIATPAGFPYLDPASRQLCRSGEHVRGARAPAQSDYRRVLEQEQEVGNTALGPRAQRRKLQIHRLVIRDEAQVDEPGLRTHFRLLVRRWSACRASCSRFNWAP